MSIHDQSAAKFPKIGPGAVSPSTSPKQGAPGPTAATAPRLTALRRRMHNDKVRAIRDGIPPAQYDEWIAPVSRREVELLLSVVDAAYVLKHEGRAEPLHDALYALDGVLS